MNESNKRQKHLKQEKGTILTISKLCSICNSVICETKKMFTLYKPHDSAGEAQQRTGQPSKQNKTNQSRNHTLDGESTECFLVAHHQQLAHLNRSLELLRLVACGLQALQELLSLGAWKEFILQNITFRAHEMKTALMCGGERCTHWLRCQWSCETAVTCGVLGAQKDVGGDLGPPVGL